MESVEPDAAHEPLVDFTFRLPTLAGFSASAAASLLLLLLLLFLVLRESI